MFGHLITTCVGGGGGSNKDTNKEDAIYILTLRRENSTADKYNYDYVIDDEGNKRKTACRHGPELLVPKQHVDERVLAAGIFSHYFCHYRWMEQ